MVHHKQKTPTNYSEREDAQPREDPFHGLQKFVTPYSVKVAVVPGTCRASTHTGKIMTG